MTRRILLEIAIGSIEDALIAQCRGVDRVELNTALAMGGLTPSRGLLHEARRILSIPMICMIRPRAGGFCYTDHEYRVILRDLEDALEQGADGIAFGILNHDATIDLSRCGEVMKLIGKHVSVFHRAFDRTPNPEVALEQLIDLGVTRVLTSGQKRTALEGRETITALLRRSRDRIEILPAAGINPTTVREVVTNVNCNQIHASLRIKKQDHSTNAHPEVCLGNATEDEKYEATDETSIREMQAILSEYVTRNVEQVLADGASK